LTLVVSKGVFFGVLITRAAYIIGIDWTWICK